MFNSKYSNLITIALIVGIILIIGILAYFGVDLYRKYFTDNTQETDVEQYQSNYIKKANTSTQNGAGGGDLVLNGAGGNSVIGGNNTTSGGNKVKETLDGFTVAGTIEISKINLKQPILESTTAKALNTAVCLQYGILNQPGNAVIIGHNYRNGTFFSNLYKLSNGDKITITDYTGTKVTYTIYDKIEAKPNDSSFYTRNTNGVREITLSTCTDDSSMRTVIFARES